LEGIQRVSVVNFNEACPWPSELGYFEVERGAEGTFQIR
jgi:hypothetical protein